MIDQYNLVAQFIKQYKKNEKIHFVVGSVIVTIHFNILHKIWHKHICFKLQVLSYKQNSSNLALRTVLNKDLHRVKLTKLLADLPPTVKA